MFVFPVLNEFATYSFHKLRGDVVSGITIGIILIPQGLAYGQLAGCRVFGVDFFFENVVAIDQHQTRLRSL